MESTEFKVFGKGLSILCLLMLALPEIPNAAHAVSNTHVYIIGATGPTDPLVVDLSNLTTSVTLLPAISDLYFVGAGSVLFVDGAWLQSVSSLDPTVLSIVADKVQNRIPTVVVRGNPALLGDSMPGFVRLKADLPLISEGLAITGTLSDGSGLTKAFQISSGFDYSVQEEFGWAEEQLHQLGTTSATSQGGKTSIPASVSALATITSNGSWELAHVAAFSTGDEFKPYGRVLNNFTMYRLNDAGTVDYKWFNVFLEQTIEPGIRLYNSNYRTSYETDHVQVSDTTNVLVSHGPTGFFTEGNADVQYSIGVSNGVDGAMATANQTVDYPLKHANVTDTSQDADISWVHDIDPRSDSGRLSFTLMVGCTDRVPGNGQLSLRAFSDTNFDWLSGQKLVNRSTRSFSIAVAAV